MAIEKIRSLPTQEAASGEGAAPAADPTTAMATSKFAPQEFPNELWSHVFELLPLTKLFRCLLVSTSWNRLVVALPQKYPKFKLLIDILREMKVSLEMVENVAPFVVPFLKLSFEIDQKEAKRAFKFLKRLPCNLSRGEQLTFDQQFFPILFEVDRESGACFKLEGLALLNWKILEGDPQKIEDILQQEKAKALSEKHPLQLLGLLEIARDLLSPQEVVQFFQLALESKDRRDIARTVDLSLQIDSSEAGLQKIKEWLPEELPAQRVLGLFAIARKEAELQYNGLRDTLTLCETILLSMWADSLREGLMIDLIRLLVPVDLPKARSLLIHIREPWFQCDAMAAVAERMSSAELQSHFEDPIMQFVASLTIAKRGLPSASENLARAKALFTPAEAWMLYAIVQTEAHINPEASLATAKEITRFRARLAALFYLAQVITDSF